MAVPSVALDGTVRVLTDNRVCMMVTHGLLYQNWSANLKFNYAIVWCDVRALRVQLWSSFGQVWHDLLGLLLLLLLGLWRLLLVIVLVGVLLSWLSIGVSCRGVSIRVIAVLLVLILLIIVLIIGVSTERQSKTSQKSLKKYRCIVLCYHLPCVVFFVGITLSTLQKEKTA